MRKKQNFVFFFPDEMRASAVSCYGNTDVKMPHYDKLATEGTLFENCIVQNPVCSPSRCSLMTGLYVHNRGHRTLWHLLRPDEPSLFRYLKNEGYDIRWYGKNDLYAQGYLRELFGEPEEMLKMMEGNGGATTVKTGQAHGGATALKTGQVHGGENPFDQTDDRYYSFLYNPLPDAGNALTTHGVTDDALAAGGLVDPFIASAVNFIHSWRDEDAPFFLYIPSLMPHPVYNALKTYHDMYDADQVIDKLISYDELKDPPAYAALIRAYRRAGKWTKPFLAKINAVYLGMNSYVDAMLGLLMTALEERGLFQNTTLVVSSDHGDWAGDYGLVEKWPNAMDDNLVKVPLIIRTPMPGALKGNRIKGQVELFDIMPTVLELAGIDCKHTHFGVSLTKELKGQRDDTTRPAYCEGGYDPHEPHCYEGYPRGDSLLEPSHIYYPKAKMQQDVPESVCRTTMLRTPAYKLIKRTSGDNQLYDLKNDPKELINLYGDSRYQEVRIQMEGQMLDWYIRTSDTVPWEDDPRGFA